MMLNGLKIIDVRMMTKEEMDNEGWTKPATVIVLDNGLKIFAAQGNGPGELFCITKHGEAAIIG